MACLQSFEDRKYLKEKYPGHAVILGRTMSGKSYLAADIINRIDQIFDRKSETYILVVLSPYPHLEDTIRTRLDEKWTIIHFSVQNFTQRVIDNMLTYLASNHMLGKEIIVLMDDLAIEASINSNVNLFIVRAFAILRHQNISLIATIQSNSPALMDILRNSVFIYVMHC